jgi:class 3 adenylate cyclase
MVVCDRCGTESPSEFMFCPSCGASLSTRTTQRRARKVVTALFCDVAGSTALGERFDPEVLHGALDRYFEEMRAIIERHGGTVQKFIGDAVMAVFGLPRVHEDDALRAVRAAAEIQERMRLVAAEVGLTLQFRIGVNTGGVLTTATESLASGDAVNVAARFEQAAAPGEIVVGAETFELVRDAVRARRLEPLTLKGKSSPVIAYAVVSVDPVAEGVARRFDRPLVGRKRELRTLIETWQRTVDGRACELLSVLGVPGVGKTRLAEELLAVVGQRALVLRDRCLPYGEEIACRPLIDALAPVGEAAAPVREYLEHGGVAAAAELSWSVRRLLEELAADEPLILYLDDLQWAQPMLLDVLDHVAALSRDTPILLLCTARPELLEVRRAWGGGKMNATACLLTPLDSAASEQLLEALGDGLDTAVQGRVIAASEGNPLFLEQMAALARDHGDVTIPLTIQMLLSARLDELALCDREILQLGAIQGEAFDRRWVSGSAPDSPAVDLQERLLGLVRNELIRPYRATLPGGEAFRFQHLLVRDAAYDALPKADRAELHERFADWLEHVGRELPDIEEVVGWHLEQALAYRQELGRVADPGLSRRAARDLLAAARRASARMDSAAARQMLERALGLAPPHEPLAAEIAVGLAEQLLDSYELKRVDALLANVENDAMITDAATLVRLDWLLLARPRDAVMTIEGQLPAIIDRLTRIGDERGLAKAHLAGQWLHWLGGRATAGAKQAAQAAAHARAANDQRLYARAVSYQLEGMVLGRASAAELADALDALDRQAPGPLIAATVNRARAVVCRLQGRFDEARRLAARAEEHLASLGMPARSAYDYVRSAELELAAGRPASAVTALQEGDATLVGQGERTYRAMIQALLAVAHERLEQAEAARVALRLAEELSLPEDVMNFALTHEVCARLALAEGDAQEAERWARSAVAHTLQTDFLLDQARARINLARVLAVVGRRDEATAEGRAALELYEVKGDVPGGAVARTFLEVTAGDLGS